MNSKVFLALGVAIVIFFGALSAFTSDQPSTLKAPTVKELVIANR